MEENKKTVLLVDDDPLIIRMYQNKLINDGYDVLLAFNGEEAIVRIKTKKPDLIILDLMMPKMNGIETIKIIKKDPIYKDVPVIFLTNMEDRPEDVEATKNLGAVDFLVKSKTDLKSLSKKIQTILGS